MDFVCGLKVTEGAMVGYFLGELGRYAICWIISNTDSFPNLDRSGLRKDLMGFPLLLA